MQELDNGTKSIETCPSLIVFQLFAIAAVGEAFDFPRRPCYLLAGRPRGLLIKNDTNVLPNASA